MKKEELLFDAITGIREELVEEAQRYTFSRKIPWRRYAGLAACLLLTVLAGFYSLLGGPHGGVSGTDSGPASSNTAPPAPADGGSAGSAAPEPSAVILTALVLEVSPDRLLVEPDGPCEAKELEVPISGVADLPDLRAGDRIRIACSGYTLESDPPAALGVTEIVLLP